MMEEIVLDAEIELGEAKSVGKANGSTVWKGSTIGLERAGAAATEGKTNENQHRAKHARLPRLA